MQSCAATWQAFSSQGALDFLRSQQFVAEGCAAASLSLAVMPHLSCHWLRCGLATCAHTTQTSSKHTDTPLALQGSSPWFKWQPGLRVGAGALYLDIASIRCRIRWIKDLGGSPLSRAARTVGGVLWLARVFMTMCAGGVTVAARRDQHIGKPAQQAA